MRDDAISICSSDGHVARGGMADYRQYLEARWLPEFDEFLKLYDVKGSRVFSTESLAVRLDPEEVDRWIAEALEPGRLDGSWDPVRRLTEMEREGVVAEVLFPDFGLPFEMGSPISTETVGEATRIERTPEQIDAGNRAYNRWLADFCSVAPDRFAGMAVTSFRDIDDTIAEIHAVREGGLRGILLPVFDDVPLYDKQYDRVWSVLEDLDFPVNCHNVSSATGRTQMRSGSWPNLAAGLAIAMGAQPFYTRDILPQMIWGGVLARHPRLKLVMTEVGSGWVVSALESMDHTWRRSYLRRDIRDVVPEPPSEYFRKQCFLGSSLLSLAETEARHTIGVDKMMIGLDFPHHEGLWYGGTSNYLRATLGAAGVSEPEARMMLGENASAVFGLPLQPLAALAQAVGPHPSEILVAPAEDRFPRGDVHKPLGAGVH